MQSTWVVNGRMTGDPALELSPIWSVCFHWCFVKCCGVTISLSASDLRDDLPCYVNVIMCNFSVLGTAGDPWKVQRNVFLPGKTCPIAHMPKCAPWITADWTNLHWSFDQHLYSCSGGRDPHKVLQFYSAQLPHNRCRKDWTRWKRLAAGATALRVTDFASVPIVWFKASKSCDRENYKKS